VDWPADVLKLPLTETDGSMSTVTCIVEAHTKETSEMLGGRGGTV
jgi:hypothetical protein